MRLRPPTLDDAPAITDVVVARDIVDHGEPDYVLEDLLEEWGADGFALDADAVVAEDAGAVVGYAAMRGGEVLAVVDPRHDGRGFGTALLEWAEGRARERGHDRHRQDIGERNAAGAALLRARGYEHVRSYWRMLVDLDDVPAEPPPAPDGLVPRPLDPDGDADALYAVNERAFTGVAAYRGESPERFRSEHLHAEALDPRLSVVAERATVPVAFALCRRWAQESRGYVDLLAVDPSVAGRGVGSWLLHAVFARCKAAGLRQATLGVASDNPRAAALYERAGMRVHMRIDSYERAIEPAG